jgi:hypothetical protein
LHLESVIKQQIFWKSNRDASSIQIMCAVNERRGQNIHATKYKPHTWNPWEYFQG